MQNSIRQTASGDESGLKPAPDRQVSSSSPAAEDFFFSRQRSRKLHL